MTRRRVTRPCRGARLRVSRRGGMPQGVPPRRHFFSHAVDWQHAGRYLMNNPKSTMAQQIAQAAIAFEQRRTGNHMPKSVTVVLSEGTLVITLHEALSPAERVLSNSPEGAAQMQEFH